jgi:hypothetical protein
MATTRRPARTEIQARTRRTSEEPVNGPDGSSWLAGWFWKCACEIGVFRAFIGRERLAGRTGAERPTKFAAPPCRMIPQSDEPEMYDSMDCSILGCRGPGLEPIETRPKHLFPPTTVPCFA